MFATKIRHQVKDANIKKDEKEALTLRSHKLDIRLELEQKFTVKSSNQEESESLELQGKQNIFAKRLSAQESTETKRILLGCGEGSFFHKKSLRRALSSNSYQQVITDKTTKNDEQQKGCRHSNPEVKTSRSVSL